MPKLIFGETPEEKETRKRAHRHCDEIIKEIRFLHYTGLGKIVNKGFEGISFAANMYFRIVYFGNKTIIYLTHLSRSTIIYSKTDPKSYETFIDPRAWIHFETIDEHI